MFMIDGMCLVKVTGFRWRLLAADPVRNQKTDVDYNVGLLLLYCRGKTMALSVVEFHST